jgi:DnaK suppressor protein
LEEERERLTAGRRNIDLRLAGKGPLAEGAEVGGDLDEHQGDGVAENVERQTDVAHQGNVAQLLNQIDRALEKMEQGRYGICDRCGGEIDRARLKALPWANLCLACQGRMESG